MPDIGDVKGKIEFDANPDPLKELIAWFGKFDAQLAQTQDGLGAIEKKAASTFDVFMATLASGVVLEGIKGIGEVIRETATAFVDASEKIVKSMTDIVMEGAMVGDVSENFDRLTTSAGQLGNVMLGALQQGTHNTVDNLRLMKMVNQDLGAGMNLTATQMKTLADGAFALAQATGKDVATSLETMNNAMLTGRTRTIALLTGKIDLKKAEEEYAASLGRAGEKLTEEGKLEADRIAILKAVGDETQRLGAQTDGLDEFVAQAETAWANFRQELGKNIANSPVLLAGLESIRDVIQQTFSGGTQDAVAAVVKIVNEAAIGLVSFAETAVTTAGSVVSTWNSVKILFGDIAQVINGAQLAALYLARTTSMPGSDQWKKQDAEIQTLLETMAARGVSLKASEQMRDNADKMVQPYLDRLKDLKSKMQDALDDSLTPKPASGTGVVGGFQGPIDPTGFVGPMPSMIAPPTADRITGPLTEGSKKAAKEASDAIKTVEKAWLEYDNAVAMSNPYTKQTEAIDKWFQTQVASLNKAKLGQKDYFDALAGLSAAYYQKLETVGLAEMDKLAKLQTKTFEEGLKPQSEFVLAELKRQNAGRQANLNEARAMQFRYNDDVAKATLNEFDYQRKQLEDWQNDQEGKLDYSVDGWEEAYSNIQKIVGEKLDEIQRQQDLMDVKVKFTFVGPMQDKNEVDPLKQFGKGLGELTTAFGQLSQVADGSLGEIVKDIGNIVASLNLANKSIEQFKKAQIDYANATTKSGKFGAIASGAAAAVSGYGALMQATSSKSIWANVAGGAATGAEIGTAIMPGWGTVIGLGLGALVGWLRSSANDALNKLAKEVSTKFGVEISDDLSKVLADASKKVGDRLAVIMNLDKIAAEAGGYQKIADKGDLDKFVDSMQSAFQFLNNSKNVTSTTAINGAFSTTIKTGQALTLTVEQLADMLDKNFTDAAAAGTNKLGFLDDKLRLLIKTSKESGVESKAVTQYLTEQAKIAVDGIDATIAALTEELPYWDDLKKRVDDAREAKEKAVASGDTGGAAEAATALTDALKAQSDAAAVAKDSLDNLTTVAVAGFVAAYDATGNFAAAMSMAAGGILNLKKSFDDLGLTSTNALFNILGMEAQVAANNPTLMKGVAGLGQAFAALNNMGMLNVDTFQSMEKAGYEMYVKMQGEVAKVGGGTREALLPMQTYLQQAAAAAKELGIPLDDNTQMMINQSKELGIWKEAGKSANDKMIAGLDRIGDALDRLLKGLGLLPAAAQDAADGIPDNPFKDWKIPDPNNIPDLPGGFPGPGGTPEPAAAGGGVAVRPTRALIGEGGEPEAILPISRAPDFFAEAMGQALEQSNTIVMQDTAPRVARVYLNQRVLAEAMFEAALDGGDVEMKARRMMEAFGG